MGTTTSPLGSVHIGGAAVFTKAFDTLMDTPEDHRKLVEIKVPPGLVDMFGRPYPERIALWVHHFDDYGVLVEGTYDVYLARRGLKRAGYKKGASALWGWRCTLIGQTPPEPGAFGGPTGGRSCVAFYFDVRNS